MQKWKICVFVLSTVSALKHLNLFVRAAVVPQSMYIGCLDFYSHVNRCSKSNLQGSLQVL